MLNWHFPKAFPCSIGAVQPLGEIFDRDLIVQRHVIGDVEILCLDVLCTKGFAKRGEVESACRVTVNKQDWAAHVASLQVRK